MFKDFINSIKEEFTHRDSFWANLGHGIKVAILICLIPAFCWFKAGLNYAIAVLIIEIVFVLFYAFAHFSLWHNFDEWD